MNSICKRIEKLEQASGIAAILLICWREEGELRPAGPGMVVRWMFDGEEEPAERGNR
jgi:hypothetical protein